MITVGGSEPLRAAPAPFAACGGPPIAKPAPPAEVTLLRGDCPAVPALPSCAPPLLGSGLFRISFNVEVEDDGVMVGEFWESLEPLLGEAEPSLESFFLEDLLESFPR